MKPERRILVDADACPVKDIIVEIARKYHLGVIFFTDTAHVIKDDYAQVVVVEKGSDSVDFALINHAKNGDIIVTQDYGLAAMALSKSAHAVHPDGFVYSKDNIDRLLFERYLKGKIRRAGGRHSGPKKRNTEADDRFSAVLEQLCRL